MEEDLKWVWIADDWLSALRFIESYHNNNSPTALEISRHWA